MGKRVGYRAALDWLAANDDCEWVFWREPIIAVSAALVRDLWDVPQDQFYRDLRDAYGRYYPNTAEGWLKSPPG